MKLSASSVFPFLAAALSALLLWAAFPPMGETAALAFALSPLLVVARTCSVRRSGWMWLVGGFLFWMGTISWMPAIIKNNGPWPLVLLGWFGLAAYCALYFGVFGALCALAWQKERKLARSWARVAAVLVVEPMLWAGLEWLRSWLFTGFAWNFLGTAAGAVPSLASPARLGGVYLVSAMVVMVNGVFATLACRVMAQMRGEGDWLQERGGRIGRWMRTLETALPLGAVLLAFWLGGTDWAKGYGSGETKCVEMRVALVQRNAPCIFARRDEVEDPAEAFSRLLSTASAFRPDLVVWAESAMAEFGPLGGVKAKQAAERVARETGGAALLAGGDWSYWVEGEKSRRMGNGAALYQCGGDMMEVYTKQHLVPFGEYIPFDKWIPALQKLSPIGVSLWPGEGRVMQLALRGEARGSVGIAPLICFEDTDPALSREAARAGAEVLVLITNDSWFSRSNESVQHAWQAVLRAIETGLPVVRVGNSGVTGVVNMAGRCRWLEDGDGRLLLDAPGSMLDTVVVRKAPGLTPYSRCGDLPLAFVFLLALLAIVGAPGARKSTSEADNG